MLSQLKSLGAVKIAIISVIGALLFFTMFTSRAQPSGQLKGTSLNVENLNYGKELTAIYLGDFEGARLQRNDGPFITLFPQYVSTFARRCAAYLPDTKVEIMKTVCARESTPVNVYGNPVGATTCVEYRNVGTGLYAKPDLLSISLQLQGIQTGEILGDYFNQAADPLASSREMTDVLLLAYDDMEQLFSNNQCDSAAIQRLEGNLARFARGETPVRLASRETLADVLAKAPKRDTSKPADHARLIDDLIAENARGWMMNRYIRGSVSDVNIQNRDAQGRPNRISARYSFSQLGQHTSGSVAVAFQDGLPKCLYFFDAPSTCRIPSPRIANAYERGEY